MTLSQEGYIRDILTKTQMSEAASISTPADTQMKLTIEGDPFSDPKLYRQVVGSLQ